MSKPIDDASACFVPVVTPSRGHEKGKDFVVLERAGAPGETIETFAGARYEYQRNGSLVRLNKPLSRRKARRLAAGGGR
jgi:hypothetical protein